VNRSNFDIYGQHEGPPEREYYQDRPEVSKRVWAGVSGVVTAVLVDPNVQAALGALLPAVVPPAYLPIATALLGVALTTWSKAADPRPIAPKWRPEQ
jgi:hypothetical protein